jgi:hypothetical protein
VSVNAGVQTHNPDYAIIVPPKSDMRRAEFKLFHHYTTCVAKRMPCFERSEVGELWSVNLPQLAFSSDAVLSSVLGLAALDCHCCDTTNTAMKRSAQYYLAETVTLLKSLISNINADTAESAMIVAVVVTLQMRVRSVFIPENEPHQLPFELFSTHAGIAALAAKTTPIIEKTNIMVGLRAVPQWIPTDTLYEEALPSRMWQDSRALLEGFSTDGYDPQTQAIYEGSVCYLNSIYIALLRGEDAVWTRRRLCEMPSNAPKGFVGLLEQHDARAMAILARFQALLKPCNDGSLYYDGCAEYEVEGIASLMPPAWLWAMEFPREILNNPELFLPDPDDTMCITAGQDFGRLCVGETSASIEDALLNSSLMRIYCSLDPLFASSPSDCEGGNISPD